MHKVLMQRSPSKSRNDAWLDFMGGLGKDLTQEQRDAISGVYTNLQSDSDFGAEYSRAAIQYLLYGGVTEQYVVGGKAWSKIQKLFKAVQTYLARTLGKDIETNTEAAAVIRDSVDLVLKSDPTARITNQAIAQQARKKADGTVDTDVIVNADKAPSKKKAVNAFDKYFFTASSVLSKIHPEFTRLFQQYFDRMGDSVLKSLKTVRPFIQKFNGIQNQKDKKRLKQLLYYSPSVTERTDIMQQQGIDPEALLRERDQLLAKYNMLNDYSLYIVPVLARIRSNAQAQGIEVGELSDYFPRRVKDLDGLRESLGQPVAEDFRSYIDRINFERGREQDTSKKKPLIERGSTEEALEFEKYLRSGGYTQSGITPRNLNQRTYEFIRDEDIDFYADPGEAIESYIQAMVTATETKRFIGKRYEVDGSDIILFPKEERPGELGLLIQDLLQRGEIDETQAFQSLPDFTKMILNPMMKENPALGALRTFSYFTLLVEPTSTISQIFDLPFQMFENGFFRTVGSMVGGKTFRLEDVGISNEDISAEFRNETKVLNDALRIGLRATGFARLDQLMKETNLNANYRRIRSQARRYLKNRNTGQSKRLKTELDFLLGNDADAAIAAFADGDRNNPLVREVLLRKLLETQPVNILEMPLAVAQNPNLRMLYTMKSFMIKQLTFVKDRMLVEMFGADKTPAQRLRGAADLSKLMFFMMLVGMPADALKDFLAGRSGYLSDYIFNGIGRVFGISRYQAYVARKEGIGQAVFDFVTPVAIQQGVDNTAELQRVLSGEKAITDSKLVTLAPLSDVLNRIFGFSQEREFKEFKRRQREGEAPLFIPPGAF
jgi:VanZ family protein